MHDLALQNRKTVLLLFRRRQLRANPRRNIQQRISPLTRDQRPLALDGLAIDETALGRRVSQFFPVGERIEPAALRFIGGAARLCGRGVAWLQRMPSQLRLCGEFAGLNPSFFLSAFHCHAHEKWQKVLDSRVGSKAFNRTGDVDKWLPARQLAHG